jgi:hypothetical protein
MLVDDEGGDPTIATLYKATYGLLLFEVPHKGMVIEEMQNNQPIFGFQKFRLETPSH